jgi:hypothetical protein
MRHDPHKRLVAIPIARLDEVQAWNRSSATGGFPCAGRSAGVERGAMTDD